jgi:hypothetical protein
MMIPKWEPAIPSLSDYIYHRPGLHQKSNNIYIVTTLLFFINKQTHYLNHPLNNLIVSPCTGFAWRCWA